MAVTTFLFTDIEGSTRLWETHPDSMRAALAAHDETTTKTVDAHGGRVVKHMGDGAIAAFASAGDGIDAAIALQDALADQVHPDVGALRVRMGIHSGEVEARDGDYFGPTLNRTARLMAAGHGGQVLVSLVTERLAGDRDDLVDLGEHRLRDLSRPERIFQVGDGHFPPLRTLDATLTNLPVLPTSFIGRDEEVAELTEVVRRSRLTTITGVGGAGKTRLALQVAGAIAPEFPGGAWLVELAAVTDPDRLAQTVLATLGVVEGSADTPLESIMAFLSGRPTLLVIDNCEHLVRDAAELVDGIRSGSPTTTIVATSRELLGLRGETAFAVGSLAMPSRHTTTDVGSLARLDAVRLFVERAAEARHDFTLDEDNAPAVAEICRRLDGMPLALELAAARIRTFPPTKLAELLDQRFRLLTGGARTALPRQQTLAATIEWSYRLLDVREQSLFRRLSAFQGGFDFEAATAVATGDPLDEFDLLELIPSLVDKSLVAVDDTGGEPRYRLLETIRQFARDLFEDTDEADDVRRRHAEYLRDLVLAADAGLDGPTLSTWQGRIAEELDNLRQAITWAVEHDRGELALEITTLAGSYWYVVERPTEGLEWIDRARAAAAAPGRSLDAASLEMQGALLLRSAGVDPEPAIRASLDLFEELHAAGEVDEWVRRFYPRAVNALSILLSNHLHEFDESDELSRRQLALATEFGNERSAATARRNLAFGDAWENPDADTARRVSDKLIDDARHSGSWRRLYHELATRAQIELDLGEPEAGGRWWLESADVLERAGIDFFADLQRSRPHLWRLIGGDEAAAPELGSWVRRLSGEPEARRNPKHQAELVSDAALIAAVDEDWERVATAWGIYDALTEHLAPTFPTTMREFQAANRESARQALGDDAFERAHHRGRSLSPSELLDFLSE